MILSLKIYNMMMKFNKKIKNNKKILLKFKTRIMKIFKKIFQKNKMKFQRVNNY